MKYWLNRTSHFIDKTNSKYIFYALGLFFTLFIWWLITVNAESNLHRFAPDKTFAALIMLPQNPRFWPGLIFTLQRLFTGLLISSCVGIPVGLLVGYFKTANYITHIPFQFLRMISPLSWTPIAIILFGIGSGPVYFLVFIAAVWPIIINTSAGVQAADKKWLEVAKVQGANNWKIVRHILLRASLPHILTGIQLALGVAWIVLVPAEMLGVASGLGYMILDFRDVNDYGGIMAIIIIIGTLGFLTDLPLRYLVKRTSWN